MRLNLTGAALVLLILAGCATARTQTIAPGVNWIFTSAGLEEDRSTGFAIVSKDAPGEPPEFAEERGSFGKIAWLYSLLDRLNLHTKLTVDQKEALLKALFTRIPAAPTADFYRAVAIGGFFTEKPLILYAQAFKPSAKAPAGSAVVLQFTGNFIVTTTKATGETNFTPIAKMISPGFNWYSNGIVFTDGRVVGAGSLYSKADEDAILKEAGGDELVAKANLTDLYIKDEVPENDAGVEASLLSVASNPSATVETQILARVNLGMYYLSVDNPAKAAQVFADAKGLAVKVTEPSFLEVVNVQAPHMLELYHRLTGK